jgi:hypothetical protein
MAHAHSDDQHGQRERDEELVPANEIERWDNIVFLAFESLDTMAI